MIRLIVFFITSLAVVLLCYGDNVHLNENRPINDVYAWRHKVHQLNLNEWFDNSIPVIKEYFNKHGLEPLEFPAFELPVPKIPGINPSFEVYNGLVVGTTNFTRAGDILVRKYDGSWQIDLQIRWKAVEVHYDYLLKYFIFNRKGSLVGQFENFNVAMVGSIDCNERAANLKYLKIIDVSGFSIKLKGHLIDPVVNTIIKGITFSFRNHVIREIENIITTATRLKIGEFNDWFANQTDVSEFYPCKNA